MGQCVTGEAGLAEEPVEHRHTPTVTRGVPSARHRSDSGGPLFFGSRRVAGPGSSRTCRSAGTTAPRGHRAGPTGSGHRRPRRHRHLVTEQHRTIAVTRATIDQIGVADTGRLDADQDLVLARIVDVDVGDHERVLWPVGQHRGGGRHVRNRNARLTPVNSRVSATGRPLHGDAKTSRPSRWHAIRRARGGPGELLH